MFKKKGGGVNIVMKCFGNGNVLKINGFDA